MLPLDVLYNWAPHASITARSISDTGHIIASRFMSQPAHLRRNHENPRHGAPRAVHASVGRIPSAVLSNKQATRRRTDENSRHFPENKRSNVACMPTLSSRRRRLPLLDFGGERERPWRRLQARSELFTRDRTRKQVTTAPREGVVEATGGKHPGQTIGRGARANEKGISETVSKR